MAGKKLRICVVFGGTSSEHEVSRVSASSVLRNLNPNTYQISMLGITKKGRWYLYTGKVDHLPDGSWEKDKKHLYPAVISPSRAQGGLLVERDGKIKRQKVDVVFPVLHGMYGEDGTIQGLLELAGIPYVGCGVLASSVGMNKIFTKQIFEKAGLLQANWMPVYRREFSDMEGVVSRIEQKIGYPCYVKPANAGSSVGISRANDRAALIDGLNQAALHDRQLVVEEAIVGREVECSVLGNGWDCKAATVGEIISKTGFYDYDEKYKTDTAKLCIPAELPDLVIQTIRENALTAFRAIDGMGLSRVDFFVRESDGAVIINEINTLPGFTPISMYAQLWNAVGLGYGELLDELVQLALVREK